MQFSQNTDLLNKLKSGTKTAAALKVGQLVTVKKTAAKYATGATIASHVKGSTYKIVQLKSDCVLLTVIKSWVKRSDIQ